MSDQKLTGADLKGVVLPLIIQAVVGIGAAVAVLNTQQGYNDKQFVEIKELLRAVPENKIALAERAVWMQNTDRRLSAVERDVKALEAKTQQ